MSAMDRQGISRSSSSSSSKSRQRRWFFETKDNRIFLHRDGREMTSFSGLSMGPIKDISIGRDFSKGSEQALLVSEEL